MAGSMIMVTLIQTVMLLESVPALLTRLTVTVPLLSLTVTLTISNSIVTTGIGTVEPNYKQSHYLL